MEVPMEISVGQAIRLELPRDHVPTLINAGEDLKDIEAIVEFISYDVALPANYKDLEAFIALDIGVRKYYVDTWVIKETDDLTQKIKELLPEIMVCSSWDEAVTDMLAEMQAENSN